MYQYDTVTQAVSGLKKRGFNADFNIKYDSLVCQDHPDPLSPTEFQITEVYRFEGDSDPADEAVVYGIESKHGLKGVMVNGYGASADELSSEMIEKLRVR